MVAVVHTHKSLRDCLNYNEHKIKAGQAVCLDAGFYPMDAADLNFHQKLRRLEMLTELNQRTKINTLHVSLNFHPSEKLSEAILKEIAEVYLEMIGFAGQPYLLYQHFDAGHPHIHLLTTNIKADGNAINMHNIGRNQSKQAREKIELKYGLVRAANAADDDLFLRFKPVNVARALYGRMETKKAMNGIINVVTEQYRFSSLAQFNAVLGLYNVVADIGAESSRVNRHKGLVFRMLDAQGNKVGVPIKASDFASKPTLKNLALKYAKNEPQKAERKSRTGNMINMAFLNGARSLHDLKTSLGNKGIDLIVRQNTDGLVYGLTYIDHELKVIFNGSELGKAFSAKAILDRCATQKTIEEKKPDSETGKQVRLSGQVKRVEMPGKFSGLMDAAGVDIDMARFADALLVDGVPASGTDWELKRSKRKKKKRIRLSAG